MKVTQGKIRISATTVLRAITQNGVGDDAMQVVK
jgi:hypothetical protein